MHVFYTPEYGFSFVREAILADKVLKPYLDKKGEAGLYYLFAFGHPISPYASEIDLKERDKQVNAEIKKKRIGAKTEVERMTGVPLEYLSPDYPAALEAALKLRCSPDITYITFLRDQLEAVKDDIRKLSEPKSGPKKADEDSADVAKKRADTKKVLLGQLNDLNKMILEADDSIRKRVESTGMISLDMILAEL